MENHQCRGSKNNSSRKIKLTEIQTIMKEILYKRNIIYRYEQEVENFHPLNTMNNEPKKETKILE